MPSGDFGRLVDSARVRNTRLAERTVQSRRAAIEAAAWAEYADREKANSPRPQMHAEVFGGAQMNRLFRDWVTSTMSPDGEIRGDIRVLRQRARQLYRDNAIVAGYLNELANQVIGPKGILLQARATTATDTPNKRTNDEIERAWKEWGMPEYCSANRRVGWLDSQRQFVRSLAMDGELIIRKHQYFNNAFGFAIQQIDPDLLDEQYNLPAAKGRNEIRMGVELDEWGGAVAYHFWTRHPSQVSTGIPLKRIRVDASEIIHLFVDYRPGQTRGVTWLAPVMADIKMLAGMQEAELVAARMSAAKMGFLVQKNPEAFGGTAAASAKGENAPTEMETAPGIIEELPPGWEFQGFDPTHPSTAFAPFSSAIRHDTARGVNMAYSTLTGDLTQVNYSSIRAGIHNERDFYRWLQGFVAIGVCRPVYRDWISMAILMSALRVDARLASDYPVEWRGRGWPWVDPLNDAQAFEILRKNGLATRTGSAAERGEDYEENIDQIAAEEAYAAEMGVDVSGSVAPAAPPAPPAQDSTSNAGDGQLSPANADNTAIALRRRRIA